MLQHGPVWLLVADGRRARVLIEAKRGDALTEPSDWSMVIGPEDEIEPQDRPPRSFDRIGDGRHAMDGDRVPHEEAESRFLHRLAARIGTAEKQRAFDHLVIAAPPRALGLLRQHLPTAAMARVRAEVSKDLVDETPASLRDRLHELIRG
jgi:protein required for attachment to host cells